MLRLTLLLISLRTLTAAQNRKCENVIQDCPLSYGSWTRCYEEEITTCVKRSSRIEAPSSTFVRRLWNSSQEAEVNLASEHRVRIPPSALRGPLAPGAEVMVVVTVLNSTHLTNLPRKTGCRIPLPGRAPVPGSVMGDLVLVVKVGNHSVSNLSQPVRLTFKRINLTDSGTCVFWQEAVEGHWSREGCETSNNDKEFICSCDHLSFFAVLVLPQMSTMDKETVDNLDYISYIGSALSVCFSITSLIVYTCLQRRRPEKSISIHMQLTTAILCLHLSFLLGCLWAWIEKRGGDGVGGARWVCQVVGSLLHWSLLATFTWMALEGFHLYLLLVRVFNIYIRKYLLKLSLVGWGLPTVVAVVCGILGVYGKYTVLLVDASNPNTTSDICWIRDSYQEPIYKPMASYMGLVLLFNTIMLVLVLVKLWRLRTSVRGPCGGKWKGMEWERSSRLCKDLATVLGLSCVLGLSWGPPVRYFTVPRLYLFTVLNSLQGVFMFLWSVALMCKARSDGNSLLRDSTTQKMAETSLNN